MKSGSSAAQVVKSAVHFLSAARAMGEACPRRDFIQGDDDEEERKIDDSRMEISHDRLSREMAEGGKDRDSARQITGSRPDTPCNGSLVCVNEMCRARPDSKNKH